MIPSKGNNQFKDNKFDFWTWSAPILQTQEEVVAAIHRLKLIGRTIKDIQAVGYGYDYNLDYDDFRDFIEAVYKGDDKALASMEFPCSVDIDEPLLIQFEDGDTLGIDFSEGSSIRMEMNTLPWRIGSGINAKNFHANQLFSDILGSRIDDIVISSSISEPDFTGSHGMDLDEQESYLRDFAFVCHKVGHTIDASEHQFFKFMPIWDYGRVYLKHGPEFLSLSGKRLKDVLDGYVTLEDIKRYYELF